MCAGGVQGEVWLLPTGAFQQNPLVFVKQEDRQGVQDGDKEPIPPYPFTSFLPRIALFSLSWFFLAMSPARALVSNASPKCNS